MRNYESYSGMPPGSAAILAAPVGDYPDIWRVERAGDLEAAKIAALPGAFLSTLYGRALAPVARLD